MATALYPGSFDPVHNGHLAVIRHVAGLFDRVVEQLAAFVLNALRVLALAKLADGGAEITVKLHDRAGNISMVVLFTGIFAMAVWLERRQSLRSIDNNVSQPKGKPVSA